MNNFNKPNQGGNMGMNNTYNMHNPHEKDTVMNIQLKNKN